MTEKIAKPHLRFAGFDDTWEQRKFEDIAVRSSSISSESGLPRVEYEDITKFIRVRLYVFCFNS